MRIDVFREGVTFPRGGITARKIRHIAEKCAGILEIRDPWFSVIITDDAYIRKINREFRDDDRPTDVISFSNRENPFPTVGDIPGEIGDVYISIERAEIQAAEYHVSLAEEMKRLVIHGILHLVGFDHERSDEDEELMRGREEEICRAIND